MWSRHFGPRRNVDEYAYDMTMNHIVALGKILSDPMRVGLLDALSDGRSYTMSELRHHVGVAASTASEHLAKLLDADLVDLEPQGRNRYYRIKNVEVAQMLESLWQLGTNIPVERGPSVPQDLAFARTCYDHLAGSIAVGITDELAASGRIVFVDLQPHLTDTGIVFFESLGLPEPPPTSRRATIRRCLDWSERKPHLGGALPAGLLQYMLSEKWFARKQSGRALRLTDSGRQGPQEVFGYAV
jgi:DNA-binding transcriptional ArsR family regulator